MITIENRKVQLAWKKQSESGCSNVLRGLQESCCAKRRKVLETVAEAFEQSEELLHGTGETDFPKESEAQSGSLYEVEVELCDVREEVKASKTEVKELEKLQ